jgi:hypothetical protein
MDTVKEPNWGGRGKEGMPIHCGREGRGYRGIGKQLLAGRGRENAGASRMGGGQDIYFLSRRRISTGRGGGEGDGRLLHRGKAEGRVTQRATLRTGSETSGFGMREVDGVGWGVMLRFDCRGSQYSKYLP